MDIPGRVAARAASRFSEDPSGCLVSLYSVASHGYAQVGWKGEMGMTGTTAHRAAWVHHRGQIPDDMTVDHVCKNRRCVNVAHLRLLTNFENARRTAGRDWKLGQCINGHPNEHLHVRPNGRTRCTRCNADYQRAYRDRKKENR